MSWDIWYDYVPMESLAANIILPCNIDFRRILKKANVVSLHALPEVNKIIIHSDGGLESYSSDLLARVTLLSSRPQELDASREQVSGSDVAVLFVRVGRMGGRTMRKRDQISVSCVTDPCDIIAMIVLYATKSFMQVTLHALEVLNAAELNSTLRRSITGGSPSFRPFGEVCTLSRVYGAITDQFVHSLFGYPRTHTTSLHCTRILGSARNVESTSRTLPSASVPA